MHTPAFNEPQVDMEDVGDVCLKSYRLQTKQADAAIELTHKRDNCWLLKITEPSGAITEIRFASQSEVWASIDSN